MKTSTWKHEEIPDLLLMRADLSTAEFIRQVRPPAALQAPPLLLYRLRPSPGFGPDNLLLRFESRHNSLSIAVRRMNRGFRADSSLEPGGRGPAAPLDAGGERAGSAPHPSLSRKVLSLDHITAESRGWRSSAHVLTCVDVLLLAELLSGCCSEAESRASGPSHLLRGTSVSSCPRDQRPEQVQ
ncbi:unnamed protein product [Pleuronectes platessa]|uniref:Uncharacterized protein n=1 Tax=Pleuronectes platessa TaxID=8262 RepID=A0A9N7UIU2_PLEPL|nr:unnamed protein product [Pleuronectes platessa]